MKKPEDEPKRLRASFFTIKQSGADPLRAVVRGREIELEND